MKRKAFRVFFDEILGILDVAMKPFDIDSWWDKIRFPLTHKKMWAVRNMTLADLLDKYVQDPKLRCILSVYWPYYGLPPSKLSGFYYAIAKAAYVRFGGNYIKHRSQDLSEALMEAIEDSGGQILLHTEVAGITMKDGAVNGVVMDDGRRLDAKAVISNASVPTTMELLSQNAKSKDLPQKATKYLEKFKAYRPSLSAFVVWLGLKQEVRNKVEGYEIFLNQNLGIKSISLVALMSSNTSLTLPVASASETERKSVIKNTSLFSFFTAVSNISD